MIEPAFSAQTPKKKIWNAVKIILAILVILGSSLVFVWSRVSPLHVLLLVLSIGLFSLDKETRS